MVSEHKFSIDRFEIPKLQPLGYLSLFFPGVLFAFPCGPIVSVP